MFKSPVKRISLGGGAAMERRVVSSCDNSDEGLEYGEEDNIHRRSLIGCLEVSWWSRRTEFKFVIGRVLM